MDELLFPKGRLILEEAKARHSSVWAFAMEAIDLSHRAYERHRELTAAFVPGVPRVRRVRNDINDDCWRYFNAIGDPLIEAGLIREFKDSDGGDVVVLPDGLQVRIKKCDTSGRTSNYPTAKIRDMAWAADRYSMYEEATELDLYIRDGLWIDVAFEAGEAMGVYNSIGLRFSNAEISPFVVLEAPAQGVLQQISPAASDLVSDYRTRLSA